MGRSDEGTGSRKGTKKRLHKTGGQALLSSALAPEHIFIVEAAVRTGSVAEFNLTPSAQERSVCTGVCCFAGDEGGC